MQSGVSRRSWINLPQDTYKSNGRIRHERVNICVGPLLNIQVHSYQAFESKERQQHGGTLPGDLEHFDIYIFRNSDLIEGKPFEHIKLNDLSSVNSETFIGYNELAREKCLLNFLKNNDCDADIINHNQSIILTSLIYKSILEGGKKEMEAFDLNLTKKINNIGTITDYDLGFKTPKSQCKETVRYGARGIVIDNNKIAIFNKVSKNEYKLPGGGIDENEMPEEAFIRECHEELGCNIEIINNLGYITEIKSKDNFKQLSFVYVAKKTNDLATTSMTQKEIDEGSRILWLEKTIALEKMKESLDNLKSSKYDSVYRTKFMVMRDIKILEYYINHII